MSNNNGYTQIVDAFTGEMFILPTGYVNNPQEYYIRNKNQDESFKKQLKRAERATENFYWNNLNNISSLLKEEKISMSTLGLLLLLCCRLNNDDNRLATQKGRPLSTAELMNMTNTPRRTFIRAMN